VPFRVFGVPGWNLGVAAASSPLLELAARSEFSPGIFRKDWFRSPISPLAFSSALWFHSAKRRRGPFRKPRPSSLRVSPSSRVLPAAPSQFVGPWASWLLSWAFVPYSTCRAGKSTCCGFAWPATFRLQGLLTLLTVYSSPTRAGSISIRQRSWDLALRSFLLTDSIPILPDWDCPPAV